MPRPLPPPSNWYDERPEDSQPSNRAQTLREIHYRRLVRLGEKVCLCGHLHQGYLTFDKDAITQIVNTCWDKSCDCSEYRPSSLLAKACTKEELEFGVVFRIIEPEITKNVFDGLVLLWHLMRYDQRRTEYYDPRNHEG